MFLPKANCKNSMHENPAVGSSIGHEEATQKPNGVASMAWLVNEMTIQFCSTFVMSIKTTKSDLRNAVANRW